MSKWDGLVLRALWNVAVQRHRASADGSSTAAQLSMVADRWLIRDWQRVFGWVPETPYAVGMPR